MLSASDTSTANRTGSELIIFAFNPLMSLQKKNKSGMKESNKLTQPTIIKSA
jgi:hypothetical protein